MNARRYLWVVQGGIVLLGTLWGCSATKPPREAKTPSLEATPFASSLTEGAEQTSRNASGMPGSEDGIPSQYWADPIKALHPVKVYTHRVNLVVVRHVHDGIEEGKYIYISISSYLPWPGDDGFEFTPNPLSGNKYTLGEGVFDFKRTIRRQ